MAHKTIYVKDKDLPLYDKLANGEDSISSRFAAFLHFEESMSDCIHRNVYQQEGDDRWLDKWTCTMCGAEFFHLNLALGKITAMESMATLRDQFAMAAMQGYIGCDESGTTFWSTGPQMVDAAKNAYGWAEALLEARK